ncbi:MAG: hypothetical protein M3332_09930, partial [Actinomycetota bacterium]|nr:hypothetical protein [Actinomycetota bacterium]
MSAPVKVTGWIRVSGIPRGAEAIQWFTRRRGRRETFDAHFNAINQSFGAGARTIVRAATDPRNGLPTTLVIEIDVTGITEEDAWSRVVEVQEQLLERRSYLADVSRLKDPFQNIAVTVRPTEEDWR